jgi:hypothetical protein
VGIWDLIDLDALGNKVESVISKEFVNRQWPAIERTLREQFDESEIDVALKAGRIACERMITHAL